MEFPDLGKHCSDELCNKLDFLPMKCDACEKIFCKDHIRYDDHRCSSAFKKDVQVPVCPLCGQPVPVRRGETPDIKVGAHIDRDCQSDPAMKKRKAFSNRCSAPRCKQRELVPVTCAQCKRNYCLRHRHPHDHDCKGFENTGRSISDAGAAAMKRTTTGSAGSSSSDVGAVNRLRASKSASHTPQQTYLSSVGKDLDRERRQRAQLNARAMQGEMTEDEALARALQLSAQVSNQPERRRLWNFVLKSSIISSQASRENESWPFMQDDARRERCGASTSTAVGGGT